MTFKNLNNLNSLGSLGGGQDIGGASTLLTGLTNYWKLYTDNTDIVGSIVGTDTSITYSSGAIFNADTDKISLATSTLISGTSDFSISFRVLVSTNGALMSRRSTYPPDWQIYSSASTRAVMNIGAIDLFAGGISGSTFTGALDSVIITRTGSVWKMYLNGATWSTGSSAASIATGQTAMTFGITTDASVSSFRGTLRDVGVWSRVLTTAEIASISGGSNYPF